jgi:hypothetical protein
MWWCEVGRQEGGGVVMWGRFTEGQEKGGLMLWSRWMRQEGGGEEKVGETGESCCGVGIVLGAHEL